MTMAYDDKNIFARILRGEIPAKKAHEDATTLAFHDINPQSPTHVLVVPKGAYTDLTDFAERASDAEIAGLVRAVAKVAKSQGVAESGYRVLSNVGADGGQEVAHLHFHIFGGRKLGRMVPKAE
jgi:histidine triad (HIT) family protein